MTGLVWPRQLASSARPIWPLLVILSLLLSWVRCAHGMTDDTIAHLRRDTRDLFYHGYDNYLAHAFPEDELRPISCKPQTRNADNPADIGLNDVLGNYSLTLVDSLSSLAILASSEEEDGRDALRDFKDGVKAMVGLYGNGSEGNCGTRACAFDLNSKVQVFETNIRGVGGLLSAHLFAIGELPIRGYTPREVTRDGMSGIEWDVFLYNGQLLRLAHDLARRLLPAFGTPTGLPYPRVNLRHGIPFYQDAEEGVCRLDGTSSDPREITETCGAGAGSLVLEFTTLSRLTGDTRFEQLAKKAFWAVWSRRSSIDLIGGGIDAENGQWTTPPLTGIGAGIDSFFEYAMKSHILVGSDADSPDFLATWQQAHAAIVRHISRFDKFPFYGQSDLSTGAPRYSWVDNLSAYYPGLLTLAGELDEAVESHLLFAALWTRYSALPERWHVYNNYIDPNFKHWAGRPEFIESTYYLYQATNDPYYLHVGEMALRDIRRRCWAKCGWADLGDVITGEQRDRMESFFLGETAKYLFLLFESKHPLNHIDKAWVFTTEGHPLLIPKASQPAEKASTRTTAREVNLPAGYSIGNTCPLPIPLRPLSISNIPERPDYFHAAAMVGLDRTPVNPARGATVQKSSDKGPAVSLADVRSPTNYTFYPWTLSEDLVPVDGVCREMSGPMVSTLTFPNLTPKDSKDPAASIAAERGIVPLGALRKVMDGIVINSLSNVRLSLIQEPKGTLMLDGQRVDLEREYRVHGIANLALGKDEKVLVSGEALSGVSAADPNFRRVKDLEMVDLIFDVPVPGNEDDATAPADAEEPENTTFTSLWTELESMLSSYLGVDDLSTVTTAIPSARAKNKKPPSLNRYTLPAILPTGAGAAPLPLSLDLPDTTDTSLGALPFPSRKIFYLDSTLCDTLLPAHIVKTYHALVLNRGGCSFNAKLENIPALASGEDGLQLVVLLSVPEAWGELEAEQGGGDGWLIRPLLDEVQRTPAGLVRREPIPMVMVEGSERTRELVRGIAGATGVVVGEGRVVEGKGAGGKGGLGVKRRYWFESMGVVIGNLGML